MRGHIHKRTHRKKSGESSVLYYAVVELPRDNGKRRSDWGKGFRRKRDAETALNEKLAKLSEGGMVRRSKVTVAECLTDWLYAVEGTIKPTTFASYTRSVERYLIPHVGSTRLQDLRANDVQRLSNSLLLQGGRKKQTPTGGPSQHGSPLSGKTVRNHL